jgi:hypothetical protein
MGGWHTNIQTIAMAKTDYNDHKTRLTTMCAIIEVQTRVIGKPGVK